MILYQHIIFSSASEPWSLTHTHSEHGDSQLCTMKVFLLLLLVTLLQPTATRQLKAKDDTRTSDNLVITTQGGPQQNPQSTSSSSGSAATGGEVSLVRQFSDGRESKMNSQRAVGCGNCTSSNLGTADCKNWKITLAYDDYSVYNLACGCGKRLSADSQCRRFYPNAITEVEAFAKNKCGVHLRCFVDDWDAEPKGHSCTERCLLGLVGCRLTCDTNCFYGLTCDALAATPTSGGGGGNKKNK